MNLVLPDAEKRVSQDTRIKLSADDWEQFCKKLDAPTRGLPELRQLLNRLGRFKA